jgi:hypothetical protein
MPPNDSPSPVLDWSGSDSDYFFIDPQSSGSPFDSIIFVKKIVGGISYFNVIPCNSYLCDASKPAGGEAFWLKLESEGIEADLIPERRGFGC